MPKKTHSAKEDTIALRWGIHQNVEFSFLRQTGSKCLCIYPAKAVQYNLKEQESGSQTCGFARQLCRLPQICSCTCCSYTHILSFLSPSKADDATTLIVYLENQLRQNYFQNLYNKL